MRNCGRSHFERHGNKKNKFNDNLSFSSYIPCEEEIKDVELYSSYLGKVPIKAKEIGNNVYLENIYITKKNKKVYIKVLDITENSLSDDYIYSPQQLLRLSSVVINKSKNLYNYLITLYCYLRINQLERLEDNIIKYKKLINEIKTDELENQIKQEYPMLLNDIIFMPLKSMKKLLQYVTCYNSRVDILFGAIEYLDFINIATDGEFETINNQDILIFISGVPNLDNAYWNGQYMVFGNGKDQFYPLTSIDVIGHELTHGFIQGVCDLEYKGHSGALNESYADIFGTMLEFYVYEKYKNKLLGKSDWLIGEDLSMNSDCLRSMEDPHSANQPAKMFDKYYLDPNSMIDYGGVHINSGIPNHCFYLLAEKCNKYVAFKIYLNCLFNLYTCSDFYSFRSILFMNANYINKLSVTDCLNKVGLNLPIYSFLTLDDHILEKKLNKKRSNEDEDEDLLTNKKIKII